MSTNNGGQSKEDASNNGRLLKSKKLLAPLIAAVVLGAIFVPLQTAEAFVLDVSIPETVQKDAVRQIPFSISLDIPPGEFVSVSSITLAIDEGTSSQRVYQFNSDGRRISGTPVALVSNLEITVSPETAVGQGYAYGYGLVSSGPAGSGSPVTSGSLGYGAATSLVTGYIGPATITLEGTLRSSLLVQGTTPATHSIRASIDTGAADTQQHILSAIETFTVYPTVTIFSVSDTATTGNLIAEADGSVIAITSPSSSSESSGIEQRVFAVVRAEISVQSDDSDLLLGRGEGQHYAYSVQVINTKDGSVIDLGTKEGEIRGSRTVLMFSESWQADQLGTYEIRTTLTN